MPECRYLSNHACLKMSGYWAPCCKFDPQYIKTKTTNLHRYRSSDDFNEIKTSMLDGWHQGCKQCQVDEMVGKQSLRQNGNNRLSGIDGVIEDIELSLSNECNLTCKMCGPQFSSKWQNLLNSHDHLKSMHQPQQLVKHTILDVMEHINVERLKRIKYLGGEPFITKEVSQLFEFLDEKSALENITFSCNTNCTFIPQKHMEHLLRIKKLDIGLSIDGIGNHAEYIRPGVAWNKIDKVVDKWMEIAGNRIKNGADDHLHIYTTVQAYNLHHVPEIIRYATEKGIRFNYSFLIGPIQASISALPEKYKLETIENLDADPMVPRDLIKRAKIISSKPELVDKLRKWTEDLDNATGMKINSVIPLLAKHLFEY